MSNPLRHRAVQIPKCVDIGEPTSFGIAYYRTEHELTFHLRALQQVGSNRLVVVLCLREGGRVSPADIPINARLILTASGYTDPHEVIGGFVPDPLRAVLVAMTRLRPKDGLILLFPADWQGQSPDMLVEEARLLRASPSWREENAFF